MKELENKTAYLNELAKAVRFLPGRYYKQLREILPHKPLARIKNARAGIVVDMEVLSVLQSIAAQERKRRESAAKSELRATRMTV